LDLKRKSILPRNTDGKSPESEDELSDGSALPIFAGGIRRLAKFRRKTSRDRDRGPVAAPLTSSRELGFGRVKDGFKQIAIGSQSFCAADAGKLDLLG
jgi:hypothetical protein